MLMLKFLYLVLMVSYLVLEFLWVYEILYKNVLNI